MSSYSSNSIVEILFDSIPDECGYCQSKRSLSQGMWAHTLTCRDYQELVDRGWRRSGMYCYKPVMEKTCCPQYTIRCDAERFVASKSQKKILKRMSKFLLDGERPKPENDRSNIGDAPLDRRSARIPSKAEIDAAVVTSGPSSMSPLKNLPRRGHGPDPTRPLPKKAKLLRLEKKAAKRSAGGDNLLSNPRHSPCAGSNFPSFEDLLLTPKGDSRHRLEVRLVRSNPPCEEFLNTLEQSFQVYKKYQMAVHGDAEEDLTMDRYKRFLVHSPLIEEPFSGGPGYGSFHQQYWLDDELICVGVLDILPNCVSSVYFYYHPEYRFLTLGTYSALREIALTRSLCRADPRLKYYYMGFYIHSCVKMRYKGQYSPSFLLCPETYQWYPIADCVPKLEVSKYSRLSPTCDDDASRGAHEESIADFVLVLFRRTAMLYRVYKSQVRRLTGNPPSDEEEVKTYAALVGPEVAKRMLLYRPLPSSLNADLDGDSSDD